MLRPTDEPQLAEAINAAAAAGKSLELLGRGSKRAMGHPVAADEGLDLTAFAGIVEYEPAELVLTAGTATPLAEIRATLAASGQHLACEPLDLSRLLGGPGEATLDEGTPGEGTVGGLVCANLTGSRRVVAGAVRDSLLGARGVSGTGEAFKTGGKVVKNVTGFDLCKLLAGSWGTIAALTEVSLKVLPKPEACRTLIFRGLPEAHALAALRQGLATPYEVSGAAHLPETDGVTVLRLEGSGPGVAARAGLLAKSLQAFGTAECVEDADVWETLRVPAFDPPDSPVWRLSVPPTAALAVVDRVRASLDPQVVYDWGGGLVWLAVPSSPDAGAAIIRGALAAEACGGHATLIRASAEVRQRVPVFQPQPPALAALSRRVKASFDPAGVFNPGRLGQEG